MKRSEKYKDHKYFHYFNANSHNHATGDCVVRAISSACNVSWEDTFKGLCEIGLKYGYMPNSDQCIKKYLEARGWVKMKEPRNCYNRKLSVQEFLCNNKHKSNIIANIGSHHMAAIINNVVYDIWDSSRETMHSYWVKGE